MIVLHHLEQSRSQRILWLLEELGVDYRIEHYARDPKTRLAPKSLKKIHPLGKSPVVVDGDQTLAESAVIIDTLARRYGNGHWAPAHESPEAIDYQYWLHYAEGSLMPPLLLRLVFSMVREGPMPFFVRPVARGIADKVDKLFINDQIKTHFSFVDQHLADREWFLGDAISAADIQMSFPLEAAMARGTLGRRYPNVRAYVKRFQARPAYLRALEAGGDYDFGPSKG